MFDLFEFFTPRCREAEFAEDFQLSVTVIFDVNCTIEAATNGVDPTGGSRSASLTLRLGCFPMGRNHPQGAATRRDRIWRPEYVDLNMV